MHKISHFLIYAPQRKSYKQEERLRDSGTHREVKDITALVAVRMY